MDRWERMANERGQAIQKAIQKERGMQNGWQTIEGNAERHAAETEQKSGWPASRSRIEIEKDNK